jgi:hypothetical protein
MEGSQDRGCLAGGKPLPDSPVIPGQFLQKDLVADLQDGIFGAYSS